MAETVQQVTFDVRDGLGGKVVGEGKGVPFYLGLESPSYPPSWVSYEGKDYYLYRDAGESERPYIALK